MKYTLSEEQRAWLELRRSDFPFRNWTETIGMTLSLNGYGEETREIINGMIIEYKKKIKEDIKI